MLITVLTHAQVYPPAPPSIHPITAPAHPLYSTTAPASISAISSFSDQASLISSSIILALATHPAPVFIVDTTPPSIPAAAPLSTIRIIQPTHSNYTPAISHIPIIPPSSLTGAQAHLQGPIVTTSLPSIDLPAVPSHSGFTTNLPYGSIPPTTFASPTYILPDLTPD